MLLPSQTTINGQHMINHTVLLLLTFVSVDGSSSFLKESAISIACEFLPLLSIHTPRPTFGIFRGGESYRGFAVQVPGNNF